MLNMRSENAAEVMAVVAGLAGLCWGDTDQPGSPHGTTNNPRSRENDSYQRMGMLSVVANRELRRSVLILADSNHARQH